MLIPFAIRPTFGPALFAIAACLAAVAPARAAEGCVTIEVQNVRPQQGQLMLAAYAEAETFNKKALVSLKVPAGDATTLVEMCGISGDTLAITMFQDLDSDGKMGRNFLGIPLEPWGSSGTPGSFGPSWETGKVKLDGSVIVIKLSN
jgi:uncharacterized protein (DUF2141 family)